MTNPAPQNPAPQNPAFKEPVAWQERQQRSTVEWTPWYECRTPLPGQPLSATIDGIRYEWRPLYAAQPLTPPAGWLEDLIEMAQEHADQFSAAYAGYKPERHAHYAAILKRARAAAPPAQATSLADFDAWREEYVNRFDTEPIAREGWEAAKEHFAAAPLQAPADALLDPPAPSGAQPPKGLT